MAKFNRPKPKQIGRPVAYTPALGELICELITAGNSLSQICKIKTKSRDTFLGLQTWGYSGDYVEFKKIFPEKGMPSVVTVFAWLNRKSDFQMVFLNKYNEAVEKRLDTWAEQTVTISDETFNDRYEVNKDGKMIKKFDVDHIMRTKLRVDTRKWHLERLRPKKFGLKTKIEATGPDDTPLIPQSLVPTQITINLVRPDKKEENS